MIDVRRAYRQWLQRRMLWLIPSGLLSCVVGVVLALNQDLSGWVRLPAVVLAFGVALLFGAITGLTAKVVREQAQGAGRRAQLLRLELRPAPGVGLTLLLLLLALLGVPAFFTEPLPAPIPGVVRHRRTAVVAPRTEPVSGSPEIVPSEPVVAAAEPPPPSAQDPATPPQILPEIARLPEVPLRLEDLEPPAALRVQEKESPGSDQYGLKHRPDDGDDLLRRILEERQRHPFDRSGVPDESDPASWIPPELQVDFFLISKSGPWRGRSLELGLDVPVGRDESVRMSYAATMLTDDHEFDGVEPSFTWHRGTFEYVRRIAGYTRQSMFDLAVMVGLSLDRLSTHEALTTFDSSARLSPWFGLESAIWEDDGVGLLLRVGHSLATRLTGGSSSVTEVKVVARIDLGEKSSLELGYRIVSVRFKDRRGDSHENYAEELNRSFMGPVAGFALRF